MQSKNRNAIAAQQKPGVSNLEFGIVSVLSFDNQASRNSLTSHCPNPTVAMACS